MFFNIQRTILPREESLRLPKCSVCVVPTASELRLDITHPRIGGYGGAGDNFVAGRIASFTGTLSARRAHRIRAAFGYHTPPYRGIRGCVDNFVAGRIASFTETLSARRAHRRCGSRIRVRRRCDLRHGGASRLRCCCIQAIRPRARELLHQRFRCSLHKP